MQDWERYQEDVAEHFRSLDLDAQTEVTFDGVRTTHDLDVLVRGEFLGIAVIWVVECKHWAKPVPKEKVMVLRQIVTDTGADRGFLMSESGYQKGALEAATATNVQLTSLMDLRETSSHELGIAKLRKLFARVQSARERYWELPKDLRIEHGLRGEVGDLAYMGGQVINSLDACVKSALLLGFPVLYDATLTPLTYHTSQRFEGGEETSEFENPNELAEFVANELADLERRLAVAEESGAAQSHAAQVGVSSP